MTLDHFGQFGPPPPLFGHHISMAPSLLHPSFLFLPLSPSPFLWLRMTPHKEILRFYAAILIRHRAAGGGATAIWPAHSAPSLPTCLVSAELNDLLFGKGNFRVQESIQVRLNNLSLIKGSLSAVNLGRTAQRKGECDLLCPGSLPMPLIGS